MVKRIVINSIPTIVIAIIKQVRLSLFLVILIAFFYINSEIKLVRADEQIIEQPEYQVYLPTISKANNYSPIPKVNIPKIINDQGDFLPEESAIFWLGEVTATDNYADVRIGQFESKLWIWISIIDRRLWYDETPTPNTLTKWDSVSLYLNTDGDSNHFTDANTFRFDAQLNWWEDRTDWQSAYRANNLGWLMEPINFQTNTNWWSFSTPNSDEDARAWVVVFIIPFQSLDFPGTPPDGTQWRLGLQVHDRDDLDGTPIPDQTWPENITPNQPITWGIMHFGLPNFTPPQAINPETFTLRNELNGITVTDGMVGGGTLCGDGMDFWTEWGEHSYLNARDINVQNQGNTDDWPCFSKIYITFPLDSLPTGKEIITATLTLHQSGNSIGQGRTDSLIQIGEINKAWDPMTLSWNNAPKMIENIYRSWVDSIYFPGEPEPDLGIARIWDVSRAAGSAYNAQIPLRLVLYSADFNFGGGWGKYFFSSSSTDWDGEWRPSLVITLGDKQQ